MRAFIRRAYALERRTLGGTDYTVAHYVVEGVSELRKITQLWQYAGAEAFISERIANERWECSLRFPRKHRARTTLALMDAQS